VGACLSCGRAHGLPRRGRLPLASHWRPTSGGLAGRLSQPSERPSELPVEQTARALASFPVAILLRHDPSEIDSVTRAFALPDERAALTGLGDRSGSRADGLWFNGARGRALVRLLSAAGSSASTRRSP
jgi:hypothetical protein